MIDKLLIWAATAVIVCFGIYLLLPKDSVQTVSNSTLSNNSNTNINNDSKEKMANVKSFEQVSAKSATITTVRGEIQLELYPDIAPKTVTNFATLSKNNFYDGLTFHRVESWVVQGGDPAGNGTGGTSVYGEKFEDEIDANTELYQKGYVEGTLAMANSGPNTNGSQFFIITEETALQPNYTIFGKVTSGMDVVKSIKVGDKIVSITIK